MLSFLEIAICGLNCKHFDINRYCYSCIDTFLILEEKPSKFVNPKLDEYKTHYFNDSRWLYKCYPTCETCDCHGDNTYHNNV